MTLATSIRAIPIAVVAAVIIGVPADLIDTPIFGRPVPTTWVDYAIWIITSGLIGLVFAIRPERGQAYAATEAEIDKQESRTVWAGFVSFLAVGCPVCNQLVVGAVGVSGALSWWAPVQPIVGLVAIGLLIWALRQRLATYDLVACPIPHDRPSSEDSARSASSATMSNHE